MVRVLEMFGEPITYGGQESVVYNMLSTFNLKNDFNIDLYTPYYADNADLIRLVNTNNGKIYTSNVQFKTNDNRFLLSKYVRAFLKVHNQYDVVHIHTGSLSTMLLYAMCAKKSNIKKVVAHIHIASSNQNLFSIIRKNIICIELLKYVDCFLGCSELAIKTRYTNAISKKAILIYNGIDIEKYRFNENIRKEYRSNYNVSDKFVIGSLGRLSCQKNIFFMIDIINILCHIDDDAMLFIVGTGELENELKNKVKELNLNDKVIFAGNQKEAYKFYNIFDCFILPSLYEGMPVTAIEAQISGLYTLISKNVTNECIISPNSRIIDGFDANNWTNQIMLIKNKIQNNIYRINSNIDFKKFDKNLTYKKIADIYKGDYV